MTLMQEINQFMKPEHLTIDKKEGEYLIEGNWWVEQEKNGLFNEKETRLSKERKWVQKRATGEVHDRLDEVFNNFYDSLSVLDSASLESVTLRSVHENTLGYDSEEIEMIFFGFITKEEQGNQLPTELTQPVVELISEEKEEIDLERIQELNFIFSDQHESKLVNIRGKLKTENPHLYFSNVSTFEEFEEKSENIETADGMYIVPLLFRNEKGDIPQELVEKAEEEILDRGKSLVKSERPIQFEAERLGYEEGETQTSIFIYVPLEKPH